MKNCQHQKARSVGFVFSVLLLIGAMSLTAYAAWSARSFTYNKITTPVFGSNVIEKWEPPEEGLFPGMSIEKIVQIRNEGETASIVRIKLKKRIGHYVNGEFVDDESLSTDNIVLDLNEEDWVLMDDGWYYYKEPLSEGEKTTPLLYSFSLKPGLGSEYERKHVQVNVASESVQYENNGPALWGKSYKELSMEEPEEKEGITRDTSVTFRDPIRKFDIELSKTDLFHNFKDLLPGSARTQRISVANEYNDDVEIHLVSMDLDKNSGASDKKVNQLLSKYVDVKVEDKEGTEIYKGAIKGDGECDINLGTYSKDESADLIVTLEVDPEMPADFQGLAGQVKWAFEAREVDSVEPTKDSPVNPIARQKLVQTSDIRLFTLGIMLSIVGLFGIIFLRKRREVH